jgi:hypothetical protein
MLDAVENPIKEYLNEGLQENLKKINEGIKIGYYYDPYFTIEQFNLPALYYDARLALEMGHFLTANHRYVLKADGYMEDKLIEHNKEWSRRFEEDGVEGEISSIWRLEPYSFVNHEREERAKQFLPSNLRQGSKTETYGQKFPNYYNKVRGRTYSRMGFQHDERWSVNIRKALINLEKRLKEKRHKQGINFKKYEPYMKSRENNRTLSEVNKFLGLE